MNEASSVEEETRHAADDVQPTIREMTIDSKSDEFTLDVQRWMINLFIIFHLGAIVCWNLPTTDLQAAATNFYKPYMSITGCWQQWSMFSPDPVSQNTYLGATIHYRDGAQKNYIFPRIHTMGMLAKYRYERWRKFIENTEANSDYPYWPYLGRYAAIVNNTAPSTNPVVSVDLYRYQNYIALPGSPPLEYLKMKMTTEHVIAMPSPSPLLGGK